LNEMRAAAIAFQLERRWRDHIKSLPILRGMWRYSRRFRPSDPSQGWKIHISATPLSAGTVFSRVHPVLASRGPLFKVSASLDSLAQLNAGIDAFSQIGKFLTIYPHSVAEAVDLAQQLHAITRGLCGPKIPFDVRYRRNSIVYYRYGSFGKMRNGTIFDHSHRPHKDKREPGCAVPRWLDDPFKPSNNGESKPSWLRSRGPIGRDYIAFRAISQRGKGGVYKAVDLTVSPARIVILKEGRRHGETAWDGQDGYDHVKHEGKVLRTLLDASFPVPRVLREFTQDRNRYLVLEKIPGHRLLARHRLQPGRTSWRRAKIILDRLGGLLSRLHATGWVWRDCKPWHIFVQGDKMRLIDFEGACRIAETEVLPWSSLNYTPAPFQKTFSRRAGTVEDDYALGVIAFQFLSGEFPVASAHGRATVYKRTQCPDYLRLEIERLLKF
jgi:serine/threonine protein kinase